MIKYTLKAEPPVGGQLKKVDIDYVKELNAEQLAVVQKGDGPCLVLAGAGSGKTRTLVYRVVYLLDRGVKPQNIMLLTFTNKAAKEMLERISVVLGDGAKGIWGGTFHSIGNRILRMYGERLNIPNNFTILDEEDSLTLIKSATALCHPPADKYFPKARVIRSIISLSSNLCQDIGEVINWKFDNFRPEYKNYIKLIAEKYRDRKKQVNALDFDDLLIKWNELLEMDPSIRAALGKRFEYILVDEYQDTNYLQGRVISNLAAPQNNVLVVGDDSQSIYAFRGADVNNILNFPKDFPNAQVFHLDVNYRSTPEILALANHSINKNQKKFAKHLQANRLSGQKPAVLAATDNYEQAQFICQRILDLQRDENYKLNDIAVLFRSHFQCLELEMELNKRNIPYQMRGGLRFFEQAHLKDVLAYLKILANLKDEVSWLRLLMMQAGVGEATAEKIWQEIANFNSLDEVAKAELKLGAKAAAGWKNLKRTLDRLVEFDKNNMGQIIDAIIRSGYEDYLKANYENYTERLEDLNQLVSFVASYDDLEKFLSDTALSENFRGESRGSAERGQDLGEQIVLSTIHQAKGLEWRAVFVIGLAEGLFPHAKTFDRPEEVEEERRLFYVASTRAKEQLYLTYPLFSIDNILHPSIFIKELSPTLYDRWDLTGEATPGDEPVYVDEDEEYVRKTTLPGKKKLLNFEPELEVEELDF